MHAFLIFAMTEALCSTSGRYPEKMDINKWIRVLREVQFHPNKLAIITINAIFISY